MATSPNYGWAEPDNTDLVKNGALAIRTLGNAIDTTMATMTPKSTFTAKGSIAAATAASTPANLAVGSNTAPLVADSAEATGLRWDSSAWTSYTPTVSYAGAGGSTGNATLVGRYKVRGKVINGFASFTVGSTTTFGSFDLQLSVPSGLNPVATTVAVVGWGYAFDTSAAAYYQVQADVNNGNLFAFRAFNASATYATLATVSSTLPFTLATGDQIIFYFSYEVA